MAHPVLSTIKVCLHLNEFILRVKVLVWSIIQVKLNLFKLIHLIYNNQCIFLKYIAGHPNCNTWKEFSSEISIKANKMKLSEIKKIKIKWNLHHRFETKSCTNDQRFTAYSHPKHLQRRRQMLLNWRKKKHCWNIEIEFLRVFFP